MDKERILAIAGIVLILLFFAPSQVSAGPYIAGYLNGSVVQTNKVLLMVNYQSTQASQIPTDNWLAGVSSVAGASGPNPSGWIYQNGVLLYTNNTVQWAPQAWYKAVRQYRYNREVGTGAYVAFYERTDISSPTITYKLYTYATFSDFDHDNPTIWTYAHSTGDGNFLVGKQQYIGYYIKHFQFGVESLNAPITGTRWKVLNDKPSYYDGANWRYYAGRVCSFSSSFITWIGTTLYKVGTQNYTGVNTNYTATDRVCWYYTGSPIADDSPLWSGTGVVSDVVSRPYK